MQRNEKKREKHRERYRIILPYNSYHAKPSRQAKEYVKQADGNSAMP